MKKLALLVCLLAAAACERRTEKPPAAPPEETSKGAPASRIEVDADADNLLSLAYGAAVVSRTGEMNLETSAAHAIDNLPPTPWVSPPGAFQEAIVYSLLSPARLTRVGVTVSKGDQVPTRLAFDVSSDGRKWRELIVVEPASENSRQLWSVEPVVARYIRVRTLDEASYYVRARTIHALGDEVEPPTTPPFTGCWTVNGQRARIVQQGARITGTIQAETPIHLDGGTDNRVALVTWRQGPSWGHAVLTRSPDGKHLTGLRFFETFDIVHAGDAWFGERCGDDDAAATSAPAAPRVPWPLYGLAFDAQGNLVEELSKAQLDDLIPLLATSQRMRITSHEVRYDTAEENRRHTAARIASLRRALQARGVNLDRIDFVSAGSDWTGPVLHTTLQQLFASRVELSFGT